MVTFIKDTTDYGIYILDSVEDDWITDHAGVMKEADWDEYTEGTNAIFLPYGDKLSLSSNFNFDILDFFDGAGIDLSMGEGHWLFKMEGRYGGTSETTRDAKMGNLMKLFMKQIKCSDTQLYLGYRKFDDKWMPFLDDNETIKYYCKGKMVACDIDRAGEDNYYIWKIVWRAIW